MLAGKKVVDIAPAEEGEVAEIVEASQTAPESSSESSLVSPIDDKKRRWQGFIGIMIFLAIMGTVGYFARHYIISYFVPGHNQSASTQSITEKQILYWIDPMHPTYKSDKPGKAPDCGMDLVPVYTEDQVIAKNQMPAGTIQISPYKQQLIGVQIGTTSYQHISKTIRAVGKISYDETKITRIHTKTEGWIENVYVDFTGKEVNVGDPLISIYSPELFQTQQEFLLAVKMRNELGNSQFQEAANGSHSLYQSARRRLELWDISQEQIDEIEKRGAPIKTMTLYAPANGFVLTRNAYPKQRIMPDTELYTLADLSKVWVVADIYEFEASEIRVGQQANVTLAYLPGKKFKGNVTYIYPQLDNTTRTLKVRIEIPNIDLQLKPDMYANVELQVDYGKKLTLPQEAVMDSGTEQMVFIALGDGYFAPRKVQLGGLVDGRVIVLDGVKAGEQVVTSANFLIDSESRLKTAANAFGQHNHGNVAPTERPKQPTEDHSQHGQTPPGN
ncbi:MAG: efflux RND transporter periplasmic adaptor subunit [Acidobacteriota bacterium]